MYLSTFYGQEDNISNFNFTASIFVVLKSFAIVSWIHSTPYLENKYQILHPDLSFLVVSWSNVRTGL